MIWFVGPALAADLEVGGTGEPSVAAAIANASAGFTICVNDGTWETSVDVDVPDLIIEPCEGAVPVLATDPIGATRGIFGVSGVHLTVRGLQMDGQNVGRIATVSSGGTLVLDGVDAHGGYQTAGAGAVHVDAASLEIAGGALHDNVAGAGSGGAIFVEGTGSALSIAGGTLYGNRVLGIDDGGAVGIAPDAAATFTGVRFADNHTQGRGGGVACFGVCTFAGNTFVGNTSSTDGGAVYLPAGGLSELTNNRFCGNEANLGDGGAIRIEGDASVPVMAYNLFFGNHSGDDGGALRLDADLTATNSTFAGNTTDDEGACVSARGGSITLVNTIAVDNSGNSLFRGLNGGSVLLEYALYDGNSAPILGADASDDGNVVTADPMFEGLVVGDCEASDLTLAPESPARCAGNGTDDLHLGAFTDPAGETPGDGLDSDCDGTELCFADLDGDGYAGTTLVSVASLDCVEAGAFATAADCDDADKATHPGATELPGNGVDDDCDGLELCFVDDDGDGYGDPGATQGDGDLSCLAPGLSPTGDDCDDDDGAANPGAAEIGCNGTDDDCDPTTLDDPDADGDDSSACAGDCDDGDPQIHPSAPERCNGIDDDCDGSVDEDLGGGPSWPDADGDAFGDPSGTRLACTGEGRAANDGDCDDGDPQIHPGAPERCNGIDDDCDDVIDPPAECPDDTNPDEVPREAFDDDLSQNAACQCGGGSPARGFVACLGVLMALGRRSRGRGGGVGGRYRGIVGGVRLV